MRANAAIILAGLLGFAGSALGQTANFDGFPEGIIGRDFTDAGIRFYGYDNRLDPPPSIMCAEWADGNLTGQPNFTPPNALGFGGYSQGNGAAFTRFGQMEMQPTSGLANLATVNVYEFGNSSGITLTLEATLNGNVVNTNTITLQGGFTIHWSQLHIEGEDFDHLRLYAGPTSNDVAFMLVDTVTVNSVASGLSLDLPSPGHSGMNNTLSAHDATPGERVYFVYGLRSGSTNVPGCPGVHVDMGGPTVAGSAVANNSGDAQLVKFVPAAARGRHLYLQAVEQSTCQVSNLVQFEFD